MQYKDGSLEGELISYHKNGNPKVKANYTKGREQGKAFEYADDGGLHIEMSYKDGRLDGDLIQYYKNGNPKTKTSYSVG